MVRSSVETSWVGEREYVEANVAVGEAALWIVAVGGEQEIPIVVGGEVEAVVPLLRIYWEEAAPPLGVMVADGGRRQVY